MAHQSDCVTLKIGLWNGAQTRDRQLLYRKLLDEAARQGLHLGVAVTQTAGTGGRRRGGARSVASEVGSNTLPMWLELMDDSGTCIQSFLRTTQTLLAGDGIAVCEERQVGRTGPLTQIAGGRASALETWMREGLEVRIYTLEGSKIDGEPVYQAIASFLRAKEVCWTSTVRGVTGFGASRRIRRPKWFLSRGDVPIVITVLDLRERLEPLLPDLAKRVGDTALISAQPVLWVHP